MKPSWIAAVAAAAMISGTASANPAVMLSGAKVQWLDVYGTERTDWANRFIELSDGSMVAAGFVNRDDEGSDTNWDMMVRKYGKSGKLAWSQRLGGPELDAAWAVRELADGSLLLSGFSATGSAGGWDAALTVLDPSGKVKLDRKFGGTGDDRSTDVVELADGAFLLVGQSDSSGAGGIDVFLVRTDRNGQEQWRRTYGTSLDDRGFFATATPDGGVLVAGSTGNRGSYDFLLMKVAADGALQWRRVVAGTGNDANHGIVQLKDGTIVYAGYGPSWNGRENDISVLRFAPDGKLLSHQAIGGAGDDRVQFIAADEGGGVWLTGYTKSFSPEWQMVIARLSAGGELEPWMGAIGGPGDVNGSTVSVARNGDLLLGGYSTAGDPGKPPNSLVLRLNQSAVERKTSGIEVRTIETNCSAVEGTDQRCS